MTPLIKRILLAILNLLGIVGLGTILAGRVWTGVIQMILALIAFALSLGPLIWLAGELGTTAEDLASVSDRIQTLPLDTLLFVTGLSLLGVILFFINWTWSGFTTGAKHQSPPPLKRDAEITETC
ncbi:MAG: hypothetical protein AAFY98_07980 [Verrucomicrobiota bacterium]